ncbi:hypothetical protein [Roseateles albus]|uniref:Uncharacterized protein n=1 Tax=Roseateles albus TaxID=2987525 RepID=A0ABT5KCP2_9BURK|nr:hypothetical protein [Roseateles albus]MDC8771580.1 hypothetical protein [Roseateles albus]
MSSIETLALPPALRDARAGDQVYEPFVTAVKDGLATARFAPGMAGQVAQSARLCLEVLFVEQQAVDIRPLEPAIATTQRCLSE